MKIRSVLLPALAGVLLFAVPASADGRLVFSGLRMDPVDQDARKFSRPGWGFSAEAVAPLPVTTHVLAAVVGLDIVNLLSRTVKLTDQVTGLRVEQQTSEIYGRFSLGGQLGSHSRGFLRPYAGVNIALVIYGISTDVVVPDDSDRENEIRQNIRDNSHAAFGWDANAGLDLNFNKLSIDAGVRSLHSYGVPEDLGADAVTVQPSYVQYKVGFAIPFSAFNQRH